MRINQWLLIVIVLPVATFTSEQEQSEVYELNSEYEQSESSEYTSLQSYHQPQSLQHPTTQHNNHVSPISSFSISVQGLYGRVYGERIEVGTLLTTSDATQIHDPSHDQFGVKGTLGLATNGIHLSLCYDYLHSSQQHLVDLSTNSITLNPMEALGVYNSATAGIDSSLTIDIAQRFILQEVCLKAQSLPNTMGTQSFFVTMLGGLHYLNYKRNYDIAGEGIELPATTFTSLVTFENHTQLIGPFIGMEILYRFFQGLGLLINFNIGVYGGNQNYFGRQKGWTSLTPATIHQFALDSDLKKAYSSFAPGLNGDIGMRWQQKFSSNAIDVMLGYRIFALYMPTYRFIANELSMVETMIRKNALYLTIGFSK